MVRPGSSTGKSLRTMNIFMVTGDFSLEVSFLEHKEIQHLVVTQDKSISSLYVNVLIDISEKYLDISEKSHVSKLYNSVYLQLILDCNMSHSRFKHLKSENDKFKPVSGIVSFSPNLGFELFLLELYYLN